MFIYRIITHEIRETKIDNHDDVFLKSEPLGCDEMEELNINGDVSKGEMFLKGYGVIIRVVFSAS